jgi:hypothetical protein
VDLTDWVNADIPLPDTLTVNVYSDCDVSESVSAYLSVLNILAYDNVNIGEQAECGLDLLLVDVYSIAAVTTYAECIYSDLSVFTASVGGDPSFSITGVEIELNYRGSVGAGLQLEGTVSIE